jgi:SAM-dependent methyltransferase
VFLAPLAADEHGFSVIWASKRDRCEPKQKKGTADSADYTDFFRATGRVAIFCVKKSAKSAESAVYSGPMVAPTERFSDRVDAYAKHRPSYPEALLNFLKEQVPLPATVADIGAGTGILTELLLETGYEVYAVEPNAPMRASAEQQLGHQPGFHAVDGSAEAAGLPDASVDLITAAQAFHWFDRVRAKKEFRRILKTSGKVALIWNERLDDASEVNRRYESVLKELVAGYPTVAHHRMVQQEDIHEFFAPNNLGLVTFRNDQILDREGLIGRLLSTSYVPNTGQPGNTEIVAAIDQIFDDCRTGDLVTMAYETRIYFGSFSV